MTETEETRLLREINARLTKLSELSFDELEPSQQRALFLVALDRASLGQICEVIESHPDFIEMREQKEQKKHAELIQRMKAEETNEQVH